MNKIILSSSVALLFTAVLCLNYGNLQTEAIPLLGLRCARDFVVGFISDRIMERNPKVANFKKVSQKIMDRVEQEINDKDITDKAQIEALYHRIAIDEIHQFKSQLEKESGTENQMIIKELTAQTEALNPCEVNPQVPDQSEALDIDEDKELEEMEARRLKGDITELNEKEMGLGLNLSEKDREVLQAKTKNLLKDLLHNEVRQLALSYMSTFAMGGPLNAVLQAFGQTIKSKLVKYFLNLLYDLLGTTIGRPIQMEPEEVEQKSEPKKYELPSIDHMTGLE